MRQYIYRKKTNVSVILSMQSNGVTISDWMSLVLVCDGQLYLGYQKMTSSFQETKKINFPPKKNVLDFKLKREVQILK